MLYQRKGIPEENEIVLCKVTKIYPNSVFVDLLEYAKPGMVHISEVSPGRIRTCAILSVKADRLSVKFYVLTERKGISTCL